MSANAVKEAVRHTRQVLKRWDDVGKAYWPNEESWREDQTRYALIDPILRALGWETSNPEECYTEYPRPWGGGRRVDYAIFRRRWCLRAIGRAQAEPDIIIEAKSAQVTINKNHQAQLRQYVKGKPPMTRGVAVLTNGREWQLYCVERGGRLSKEPANTVNIQIDSLNRAAEKLRSLLTKSRSA